MPHIKDVTKAFVNKIIVHVVSEISLKRVVLKGKFANIVCK